MITTRCQRSTRRRQSWRPAGELIDTSQYYVEPIASDNVAKAFIAEHHYEGTYPAARFRYGLFHKTAGLCGVAVFSQPWQHVIKAAGMPFAAAETVELSRFVLLDAVPGNGESWFIGKAFADLRARGLSGILSFSDPKQRRDSAGQLLFRGHVGTIYQATNGIYVGPSKARLIYLLPDGKVLSDRAMTKIRRQERGWEYSVELLVRHGAPAPRGCTRAWLTRWRPRICQPLHHPGNYRYVWACGRHNRKWMPEGQRYPKEIA